MVDTDQGTKSSVWNKVVSASAWRTALCSHLSITLFLYFYKPIMGYLDVYIKDFMQRMYMLHRCCRQENRISTISLPHWLIQQVPVDQLVLLANMLHFKDVRWTGHTDMKGRQCIGNLEKTDKRNKWEAEIENKREGQEKCVSGNACLWKWHLGWGSVSYASRD